MLLIRGGMFRSLVERTPSIAYKVLERVAALVAGVLSLRSALQPVTMR